ncbi:MAG: GIY-YIG nuclease family protein [Flavobacteriales bacterium]|nr:GIY-YIG nuclease family protein [Flavobacteriales bacterium]
MPLPYCVYILFSQKDHLLYVGYTSNLEKRLLYHHQGKTKSTANRQPLRLIFCEFYLFKKDALKRESYFKKTAGKKALQLMLASTFTQLNYKGNPTVINLLKENPEIEPNE